MKKNIFLSIDDFVTLLLVHLAKKSQVIDLRNPDIKYACIPFAYKEIIQNIFCAKNRWKEMFSVLINVDEYFDDHFLWEINMSKALNNVLKKLGKTIDCDFIRDKFVIAFTEEELEKLSEKYNNEEVNTRMDHFANLLNAYIYTREHKENFCDYSAMSVETMKSLNKKKVRELY